MLEKAQYRQIKRKTEIMSAKHEFFAEFGLIWFDEVFQVQKFKPPQLNRFMRGSKGTCLRLDDFVYTKI